MEQDHQRSLEQHDQDLRSLQRKTESNIDFMKQEHGMAQSKVGVHVTCLFVPFCNNLCLKSITREVCVEEFLGD